LERTEQPAPGVRVGVTKDHYEMTVWSEYASCLAKGLGEHSLVVLRVMPYAVRLVDSPNDDLKIFVLKPVRLLSVGTEEIRLRAIQATLQPYMKEIRGIRVFDHVVVRGIRNNDVYRPIS
jgi:hypothetical protein